MDAYLGRRVRKYFEFEDDYFYGTVDRWENLGDTAFIHVTYDVSEYNTQHISSTGRGGLPSRLMMPLGFFMSISPERLPADRIARFGGGSRRPLVLQDGDQEEYEEHELLPLLVDPGGGQGENADGCTGGGSSKSAPEVEPSKRGAGRTPRVAAQAGNKRRRVSSKADDSVIELDELDEDDVIVVKETTTQKPLAQAKAKAKGKGKGKSAATSPLPAARSSEKPPKFSPAGKPPPKVTAVKGWVTALKVPEDWNGTPPVPEGEPFNGKTLRVMLPSPLDILTRHHKDCSCDLCKAHISKGKEKGKAGREKKAKEAKRRSVGGDGAVEDDEGEDPEGAGDGGAIDAGVDYDKFDDLQLGSEEDRRLEKEERTVKGVVTVGARWLYTKLKQDAGKDAHLAPDNSDGLKRCLDWREHVTYVTRQVGAVIPAPVRAADPTLVQLPDCHGVEYTAGGSMRCIEYSETVHRPAEKKVEYAIDEFRKEMDVARVMEEERKNAGGGKREDGKSMSSRADLKARLFRMYT